MENSTIIEVANLGVPVQHPKRNDPTMFEWRWSSDPEVDVDAPVHVFKTANELKRFVHLAVQKQFIDAGCMKIIPITNPEQRSSITREEAIDAGADRKHWDWVRLAMAISGNSRRGPMMDTIEWAGTREEYQEGLYLQEAFAHVKNREWTNVNIFTPAESKYVQNAADYLNEHQRQMRPQLRAAQEMVVRLEDVVSSLNLDNINEERAMGYLREIQKAYHARDQANRMANGSHPISQSLEDLAYEPASTATSTPRMH